MKSDDIGRLCLTMRVGEYFVIDEKVRVEIGAKEMARGNRVRVIITAPKNVKILRDGVSDDRGTKEKES